MQRLSIAPAFCPAVRRAVRHACRHACLHACRHAIHHAVRQVVCHAFPRAFRHVALIVALLTPMGAAAAQPSIAVASAPERRAPASAPKAHPDSSFAIALTLGGGYAHYIMPYDASIDIRREGGAVSARLMWLPDHRVRFGFESGWTTFYAYDLRAVETSFGPTDATLRLSAVPLLAVFSMPIVGGLQLHAGTGGYLVRSHAVSFGSTADVTQFSQGWMGAVSWTLTEWQGVRLEAECKWYGATQFGDGVIVLQFQGGFDLFRW